MSKPYISNSGRSAFGNFKESHEAGDYILNKKAKTTFCKPNLCINKVNTQGNLNLFKKSNRLFFNGSSFNKNNLNINLFTALDLKGVSVIKKNVGNVCPTTLVPYADSITTDYPFLTYTIDPSGELFGNTTCGFYNFLDYRVPNCVNRL